MQVAVAGGYDFLIVDSISHQWDGEGGILRRKEEKDRAGGNSFANWASFTPEHTRFVEFIKQLPVHTIVTMRSKQAYVMEKNEKGKEIPRKVGLDPIQREGMEYEYTLVFEVGMSHRATTSKNRTTLFRNDDLIDLADPKVAVSIREWLQNGEAPSPPPFATSYEMEQLWNNCQFSGKTKEEIKEKFEELSVKDIKKVPRASYEELMKWSSWKPHIENSEVA